MKRTAKQDHRALFLALQADAKGFDGGISAVAGIMGINGTTLANGLNPDHDSPPPSFATVIELISLVQAKRSMFALAQLVGQYPADIEVEDRSPKEAIILFLSLIQTASNLFGVGSEFAKDNDFSVQERKELQPFLLSLMKATAELMHSIQG